MFSPVSPDGPPRALTRWCGARGGGAGRVRAPAGRLRLLRQRGDELIPDRYVRRGLASWYGAHSTGSRPLAASRSTAPSSPRPTTICGVVA